MDHSRTYKSRPSPVLPVPLSQTTAALVMALMTLTGAACSSNGSSSTADSQTAGGTPGAVTSQGSGSTGDTVPGNTLKGRFIDAAVQGLRYRTDSESGTTSDDGSFSYRAGETVVFSIGDIELPSVLAQAIVTPLDVFDTGDLFDPGAINLTRLLLSLDDDGNADNGIVINGAAHVSATGLSVDIPSPRFDDQVVNLVANSGSSQSSLVSVKDANAHLVESLDSNGKLDSTCSREHPSVGKSAAFNGHFHEVAGRLTVVDDCTLEITGFNYDGQGPDVYFYSGSSPDFTSGSNFILGPRLNGTRWTEQRIRLHIPSGKTLDDFDRISVWCIDFEANFGDAVFGS